MWEKGEAISAEFRGVESAPSYRQLERNTGRDQKSLKKWHELYEGNKTDTKSESVLMPVSLKESAMVRNFISL